MPELPEVITVITELRNAGIVGRQIIDARVAWERSVGGDAKLFHDRIVGSRIESLSYRGKHIVIALQKRGERHGLVAHLRMSGRMYLRPSGDRTVPLPYERVVMRLDTDRLLCFYDPRKFGRLVVTDAVDEHLSHLGPDPLAPSFDPAMLYEIVSRRRKRIKGLLLDQRIIAGLGNIYTDEALWVAAIHPLRISNTLSGDEASVLCKAIRLVLQEGITNHGTQLGKGKSNFVPVWGVDGAETGEAATVLLPQNQHYLRVFQRAGEPCPRCGEPIRRIVVSQRGTHICPRCQHR